MFVSALRRLIVPLVIVTVACGSGDRGGDQGAAGESGEMPAAGAGSADAGDVAAQYAPELGVDLGSMARLPSGLYMRDVEVGQGDTVVSGKKVAVKYTGWLPNGAQFDSNRESQGTLSFVVGSGDVIKGWDEGLIGMRPGGRRMLVIPPSLAYGESGYPGVIPPNSTLVFDVALISVMDP